MRKIIVTVEATLNGVTSVADWSFPDSPERAEYSRALLFSSDAILMGRETYEVFSVYWPAKKPADEGPGEQGFADRINTISKHVVSTTLKELTWNNSHLIQGDLAGEVSKLKNQPGMNIVIYGAGQVASQLLRQGLVDEFHVQLFPVVAPISPHSTRLLNDEPNLPSFTLIEEKAIASGVAILKYQPNNI